METKETYKTPKCILHIVRTSNAIAYSPNAIDSLSGSNGTWGDEYEME